MRTEWEQYLHDVAVYGQGMIYLEEKPVKQIDFSKPIENKTHEGSKVTVLQEGLTLIKSDGPNGVFYHAIDENGKSHLSNQSLHSGSAVRFENVPEEPVDTLIVYRGIDGGFRIDGGGDDQNRYTRSQAERVIANKRFYKNAVLVKVPV